MENEKGVKAFKINDLGSQVLEAFEMIYTSKGKANVLKHDIEKKPFFEYQKIADFYTQIFNDLIISGINQMSNLKKVVADFDEKNKAKKPTKTRSLELSKETILNINKFIDENNITGQDFLLMAIEQRIVNNNLDLTYIESVVNLIKKDL
ncbi:hypothetical protein [Mammaliicoccus sp. D-M17]|uniref:hypothetical protein n=1 Tax=Mammaliicoccus sp. D-M17 TaxID=2898677 RepID=UPI001EFB4D20|nr:hypothetical protein [Mammaliicoccus sp. D-M17]